MTNRSQRPVRGRRLRWFVGFVVLLLASHAYRAWRDRAPGLFPEQRSVSVSHPGASRLVQMALADLPADRPDAPVVLLLHGTPARAYDLRALAESLRGPVRVLVPDLPGYGNSTRGLRDYSIRAQAMGIENLLERLDVERVHVVGYSLGGGVAAHLVERAPDRVASLALVSSIGVQELEMLGSYTLNRALHGAQLAAIWCAFNLIPHFGLFDRALLNMGYARSLYDSDQRPLRALFGQIESPVIIVHGENDPMVPPAAALEHHRIIPQSELQMRPGSHFFVYTEPAAVATGLLAFVERVERGAMPTRATADPDRLREAARPFAASSRQPASGIALVVVFALIILSTLISEDLACIWAGLLVAHGLLSYPAAASAAFIGIFFGDLLLYAAGRFIGRPALRRAPFRWFVKEGAIQDSADWFARRGPIVILASRFVPGSRLPTYFTAGLLHQHFWKYLAYFFIAGALWAPLLVWLASVLGERAMSLLHDYKAYTLGGLVAVLLAIWLVVELLIPLCSFRGRRLLYGRWQRLRHCEFWSTRALYMPLAPWFVWLSLRHRGCTVFTAANPAMPAGGFVGESKSDILSALCDVAGDRLARFDVIAADTAPAAALDRVRAFMREYALDFPVVLKPDAGERGAGVAIARDAADVERYFAARRPAMLVQEFAPGREYGVFYYRYPNETSGRIFSVTEKEFPAVVGDGRSTLELLILRDSRAVCMAQFHLHAHRGRLSWIPAAGERVPLTELGNHCRGAIFRDGRRLITPELTAVIDAISRSYRGFYFGRYDLRVPDEAAFRAGRDFKIIELNGVTSEATSLYDPSHGPLDAWRILARQWQIAYEIGALNRAAGARVTPARELLDLFGRRQEAPEAGEDIL